VSDKPIYPSSFSEYAVSRINEADEVLDFELLLELLEHTLISNSISVILKSAVESVFNSSISYRTVAPPNVISNGVPEVYGSPPPILNPKTSPSLTFSTTPSLVVILALKGLNPTVHAPVAVSVIENSPDVVSVIHLLPSHSPPSIPASASQYVLSNLEIHSVVIGNGQEDELELDEVDDELLLELDLELLDELELLELELELIDDELLLLLELDVELVELELLDRLLEDELLDELDLLELLDELELLELLLLELLDELLLLDDELLETDELIDELLLLLELLLLELELDELLDELLLLELELELLRELDDELHSTSANSIPVTLNVISAVESEILKSNISLAVESL